MDNQFKIRNYQIRERQTQIEKENERIVTRLHQIVQSQSPYSKKNRPKSIHNKNRKSQSQHIKKENEIIMNKIIYCKPSVGSMNYWSQFHEKNNEYQYLRRSYEYSTQKKLKKQKQSISFEDSILQFYLQKN